MTEQHQGLKKPDQRDADKDVDEALDETFPASDPPSYNRGHSGSPSDEERKDPESEKAKDA